MNASTRWSKAWGRHPVVAFARHRKQVSFYRQFHALIRSGVGMPAVFAELTKYAPDPAIAAALEVVAADVERGETLAKAFARHGGLFDDANVELIAFAEEAGTLDRVLKRLIEHMEEVNRLRLRAVMMSLWPMYLGAAFIFVAPLLGAAQTVARGRSIGEAYLTGLIGNLLLAGGALLAVLSFPFVITALKAELPWDAFKRRMPGVSGAVGNLYASKLLLGLGLGVGAGLEIVRALRVAVHSTNSPSLLARLPMAESRLRSGSTLTEAVETLGLLDRVALGTLSVAEKTGSVSEMLEKMSTELQESSLRATRLLIIVVIALVAAALLFTIVSSILGTLFGPIKTFYDAAGSGSLDG